MDDQHEVSRFGHVELADMPDDLRARIAPIAEKSGFVPNVFRALARRPRELRAFLDYHDALMESDGPLSKAERELIVVATSAANDCTYCVVAHGDALAKALDDRVTADYIATNWRHADLDPRRRAICAYAEKLTARPHELSEDDLVELERHGLTKEEVWDVAEIAAMYNFTNRMALATGQLPNEEYH